MTGRGVVIDLDQLGRGLCLARALGHHQRDAIGFPAHHRGLFAAARPADHRLVGHDQAKFVDRHIGGGQHRDDARRGLRPAHVDRVDAGMGHAGEDRLHPA